MVQVALIQGGIEITDSGRVLSPEQKSMLACWSFHLHPPDQLIAQLDANQTKILAKVAEYFDNKGVHYALEESAQNALENYKQASRALQTAIQSGEKLKEGRYPGIADTFLGFVRANLPRRLRIHQEKASLFMVSVPNSANFSVPGSGKSSVVLAVFAWLRTKGECNSLFVVGPRSCFLPWQHEYEATLGKSPTVCTLSGIAPEDRIALYDPDPTAIPDLFLCTYQTLWIDSDHVLNLFGIPSNKVFFVIDEAHYIKRSESAWARSVLSVSAAASRRCVLTGTPFPHSYADAINLFDASYPHISPFPSSVADQIRLCSEQKDHEKARKLLEPVIDPLYYRVRKKDLGLSDPEFLPPYSVAMEPIERYLYDTIVDRIRTIDDSDAVRDAVTVSKLRRGRLMRLRQVLSNSALLRTVIDEYDEDLLGDDASIVKMIDTYNSKEIPGKLSVLMDLIAGLREKGEKVVVWSFFVNTLYLIQEHCTKRLWHADVVCGKTPNSTATNADTRDDIIERFKEEGSRCDILIANPSACSESISLHRTCSHAVYYDLSYNCAEYLQSIDRIHRVGGSEQKISYYHHLQYADTFEPEILANITAKADRMAVVLDVDFPSFDLDVPDIEESTYAMLVQ